MSWSETLFHAVLDDIPSQILDGLTTLGKEDRNISQTWNDLARMEKLLIDRFQYVVKQQKDKVKDKDRKSDQIEKDVIEVLNLENNVHESRDQSPSSDETFGIDVSKLCSLEEIDLAFNIICTKRKEIATMLDNQHKMTQDLYDTLDSKIGQYDAAVAPIRHLLPVWSASESLKSRSKKRKSKKEDEGNNMEDISQLSPKKKRECSQETKARAANIPEDVDDFAVSDPNEPLYCTCRRISFGEMIGCENSDCPIEWFHFPCVGLTEAPKDPWYCPICRSSNCYVI